MLKEKQVCFIGSTGLLEGPSAAFKDLLHVAVRARTESSSETPVQVVSRHCERSACKTGEGAYLFMCKWGGGWGFTRQGHFSDDLWDNALLEDDQRAQSINTSA